MNFNTHNTTQTRQTTNSGNPSRNSAPSSGDTSSASAVDGLSCYEETCHVTHSEFELYSNDLPILVPNF